MWTVGPLARIEQCNCFMNKRTAAALETLRNGGYFYKALERNYNGHMKFVTRLRTSTGAVVKGVGVVTRDDLALQGLLTFTADGVREVLLSNEQLVARDARLEQGAAL